jgi:hypothetical protein
VYPLPQHLLFNPHRPSAAPAGFGLFEGSAPGAPPILGDPQPRLAGAPPVPPVQAQPLPTPNRPAPQPQDRRARFGAALRQVGNALGQVFGGADDPRLTPEQNAAARRQGLLQGGLSMMAASAQGAPLNGALAAGASAGMEAGGGMRAMNVRAAQMQAALQHLTNAGETGSIEATIQALLPMAASGDPHAQAVLSELRQLHNNLGQREDRELTREQQRLQFEENLRDRIVARVESAQDRLVQRQIAQSNLALQREIAARSELLQQAQGISGQFNQQAAPFVEMAQTYARLRSADDTISGDQVRLISLAKLISPAVRTNEEALEALAESGLSGRAQTFVRRVITGDAKMDPQTRREVEAQARRLANAAQQQLHGTVLPHYQQRAQAAGINPSLVVYDPFAQFDLQQERPESTPLPGSGSSLLETLGGLKITEPQQPAGRTPPRRATGGGVR